MNVLVRLVLAALLVAVLVGAGVHSDLGDRYALADPVPRAVVTDYDAHVGERSLYFLRVRAVDRSAGSATVVLASTVGSTTLTARPFHADVEPGGIVQVYGELRPNHVIRPVNTVVVNPDGSSTTYKYAVSAVGALLVVVAFFRRWTVDVDEWVFEVRRDG